MKGIQGLRHSVRECGEDLMRLLFPPLCAGCNQSERRPGDDFCLYCSCLLPRINQADARAVLQAKEHFADDSNDLYALFYYHRVGPVKHLLQAMKYHSHRQIAIKMGRRLGRGTVLKRAKNACLVPVPLHHRKLKKRGYNQAHEIACGLAKTWEAPIIELLRRTRQAAPASRMGKEERDHLALGLYELTQPVPGHIEHIILVDDVLTTGTTLKACAAAVQKDFHGKISFATVAITI